LTPFFLQRSPIADPAFLYTSLSHTPHLTPATGGPTTAT
jgi:hypothetical protein